MITKHSLFCFSDAAIESSIAVKAMVTFTPDWANILINESVNITCNVGPSTHEKQRYYWYKNTKPVKEHRPSFTIQSADKSDIGEYQCHTNTSQKSDPAKLGVIINFPLILQRPLVIYEGDPLLVRCHSHHGIYATNTTFYRNGNLLQFSVTNDNLQFTNVNHNMAGTYRCTKQIYYNKKFQLYCAETYISVEENVFLDKRQAVHSFPWIPVSIVLLVIFILSLLLFIFRHRVSLLIRGGPQNYSVTESVEQNKVEEDVSYSCINTHNLQLVFTGL
ncbi:putative high affinity immunoglobulin gamma Fc receptor IC [Rana temporaria]|uniref:putative high affinity immunoglobulin gamma Fc receptor IC n=1 Tax=Rana temporaria TaxID=8407 RepID=UPI001AAD7B94|nr:putative high affinity immunoglobulin gamma Fc receptor IC [Rana temporaria]